MQTHIETEAPATPGDETAPGDTRNSAIQAARRHLAVAAILLLPALVAAILLRLELLTPALDQLGARTYGVLLSLHGSLMLYFVALPLFPGVLGHALLPKLLGTPRMAFPRLAHAAWLCLACGGVLVSLGFLTGGTEAGWRFDAAFGGRFLLAGLVPVAAGVFLAACALALLSLNFVATILQARGKPAGPAVLPPLASALLFSSALGLVAAPLLAGCMAFVLADCLLGLSLFDPRQGGDPRLFSGIFRFFGAPAFAMIFVAALGMAAQILADRADATMRERATLQRLLAATALAGLLAWGGTIPAPATGGVIDWVHFLFTALLLGAFAGLLVMFLRLLRRGAARMDAAVLLALGFVFTAVPGLTAGLALALPTTQVYLGHTPFATAHLHLILTASVAMAFLAGLHETWPQLTGRRFSESLGRGAAVVILLGTHLTFLPLFLLGLGGASYRANAYAPELQVSHVLATAGMTILLAGVALAVVNLLSGPRAHARETGVLAV